MKNPRRHIIYYTVVLVPLEEYPAERFDVRINIILCGRVRVPECAVIYVIIIAAARINTQAARDAYIYTWGYYSGIRESNYRLCGVYDG